MNLHEEFNALKSEVADTINKAKTDKRELTAEEVEANEKRFARLAVIKQYNDGEKRLAEMAIAEMPAAQIVSTSEPKAKFEANKAEKFDADRFNLAFQQWATSRSVSEKYATTISTTQSSALLPKMVMQPIVAQAPNAFREGYAACGLEPEHYPTTQSVSVTVLDPSAGGVVAENASSETENAASLGESFNLTFKPYQSGTSYFSNLVLGAPGYDLVKSVLPRLAGNKELGLESAIAAAIIADSGITQTVPAASTSAITYANMVSLNRKLPKRYQRNKVILLSPAAFAAAEGLTSTIGAPVLTLDPQNQELVRFNRTPVIQCDYLEAFGASKCIGIVLSLWGFSMADAMQDRVAAYEIPTKPDQTGLNEFGYHAFGWAVSAVAKLLTPAS